MGKIETEYVPYQLLLIEPGPRGQFCSGVLITKKYGLSAFHCFLRPISTKQHGDIYTKRNLNTFEVRAGVLNIQTYSWVQVRNI